MQVSDTAVHRTPGVSTLNSRTWTGPVTSWSFSDWAEPPPNSDHLRGLNPALARPAVRL